ncbi:MAG TPA: hypothetical protein VEF04_19360 [Blastocatellia bacterium]|nr:hypothetical protein [Blastocatellia bacterium]
MVKSDEPTRIEQAKQEPALVKKVEIEEHEIVVVLLLADQGWEDTLKNIDYKGSPYVFAPVVIEKFDLTNYSLLNHGFHNYGGPPEAEFLYPGLEAFVIGLLLRQSTSSISKIFVVNASRGFSYFEGLRFAGIEVIRM